MVFTNISPYQGVMTPITNISPLTYRDGATFLEYLENIKQWLNETLVPDTNTALNNAVAEFDAIRAGWDARYDYLKADLTAQIALLNESAVAGLVDAGTVHTKILALIDAAIAVATAANHAYTDTAVATVQSGLDATNTEVATNGYLFACFTANGADGEKLSTFYSPDGKTLFGGPGNPAYTPTDGQGVRDPSLLFYGNKWYVTYTSNNGIDKDFHIAVSDTGAPGTWFLNTTVSAESIGGLEQAWAPEFVVGDDGIYIFFTKVANNKGSMYWVKANNTNLTAFTAPLPVNFTVFPDNWIDGVPTKKDGKWYLFYGVGDAIERAVSDTLTGVYTTDRTGNWNGWGSGIEGPIIVKDGPTWRAYFDRYVAGTGYWWSESTDLDNWTSPQQLVAAPGTLGPGQKLRHGGMVKLASKAAANKVMAGQFTQRPRHLELYTVPGPSAGKEQYATFNGWAVDANETTAADIASYDPVTGFVTLNVPGGVYSFTLTTNATGDPNDPAVLGNVLRSFVEYGMVDGPQTVFKRDSGGVEDYFNLSVPNHHAKYAERIRFRAFANWNGTATTISYPARLKITLHGVA